VVEEDNYYPLGLLQTGYNDTHNGTGSKYKYNGKLKRSGNPAFAGELQDDYGLDWYDYGARFYDASLGRWFVPDPLAESAQSWSPYRYAFDNPVSVVDPNGMSEDWFENEKTGEIMNVKGENQVPKSEQGKGWVDIGKDDKFGKGNAPKGTNGTVTKMNAKKSKAFMSNQGNELKPKLSYEGIRHDQAVSSLIPGGGSVSVENLSGERVVVSRTYVKKDASNNENITLFSTKQHPGNSYTSYTKTNYTYSNNSSFGNFLKGVGKLINLINKDMSGGKSYVITVYDWKDVTDPNLLKLKGK